MITHSDILMTFMIFFLLFPINLGSAIVDSIVSGQRWGNSLVMGQRENVLQNMKSPL